MWRLSFMLFAIIFFAPLPAGAQSYEFPVAHEHTWRSCAGKLLITPGGIEYQTEQKEHARAWRYADLRQIRVESSKRLELLSYEDQKWQAGLDRVFKFKLLEGEITPAISARLMERATRPLVTSVLPANEDTPAFETPVKHLHRFGGCLGTLKLYSDRLVYETKAEPTHARHWRYGELRNFSQSERYRFEIATFEENFGGPKTYNFDLREALPAQAYDYVWARVYPSRLRHAEHLAQPLVSNRPAPKQ